jgi:hypothetical protein
MLNIKTSLGTISHEYTVFEADQVLTHEQLNGVVDYLTDQDRLTRVDLVGVGIVCGLRAVLAGDRVKLSRGVGVTTDGDLARVAADAEYTHYKRYDDTAPAYDKLAPGGTPLKTWELLPAGTTDPRAAPLTGFAAAEGVAFATLSALLLVESVDLDNDICSDTSCDSRGDRATEPLRLLLLDATSAVSILGALDTPAAAAVQLDEIVIDRPLMAGVTTVGELVARYRAACTAIRGKLAAALPKLHAAAGKFLWDADPTPGWLAALAAQDAAFASAGFGIQYYYDYLRDLAETYGALRERLSGDTAVCVPDVGAFPKHLVLGRIVPGSGADARIGFYPSPVVRAAVDRWGHARFLARKLGVMIGAWKLPSAAAASGTGIRVTPSGFGDRALEDRAIPYYYDPAYQPEVYDGWSFALSRRAMGRYNQSYHAPGGWGLGEAARPLESSLARFTFFRVEGQLGRNLDDVLASLEGQIRQYNLPITLATGMLRAAALDDHSRATELRTAYEALRAQLVGQLEQAATFARRAATRIGTDIFHRNEAMAVWPSVLALEARAVEARAGLALPYDDAAAQADWRSTAEAGLRAAGEIRAGLGTLLMAVEAAPFETVAKSAALANLDLLRTAVREEEEGSEHPLFISHLEQQPGLEHFAGAARGSTLLLVHDEDERVIADFMLPCCNCEVLAERDVKTGGAREAVSAVYAKLADAREHLVATGSDLPADRLADGLRLAPGADIKLAASAATDCAVVLELPFPTTADDAAEWGGAAFGFQRVVLDGTVTANAGSLVWKPVARTASWLRGKVSELLGPPRLDFYTGKDEAAPGWKYGLQRQLVYFDSSSRPLEDTKPVLGGAAVYRRAASGDEVVLRIYWPNQLSGEAGFQTGLVYDFKGRGDFSILLYHPRILFVPTGTGSYTTVMSTSVRIVTVKAGIAHFGAPELVQSTNIASSSVKHPPIELRVAPGRVQITEVTNTGFIKPWQTTKLAVTGLDGRIGAFTTVPSEIWELSDGALSLQPAQAARVRARVHLGRGAATWDGPPGQRRPFIPDFDTWFWLHESWPNPYGYDKGTLGATPYGYGLRDEYHGIGAELIK